MLALQVRRLLALTIILALSAAGVAQSVPADSAVVHQTLVSRGVGKSIKVKETNGTTVNGTITAIDADSFQVTPKGETKPIRVRNEDVKTVHNGGMRTGVKVAIVGVIVLVALGIVGTRV